MTLIERGTQLDQLEALLTEALNGSGRVVALVGEAGAGKTALMEVFAARAKARVRILRGACEDLSIADTLAPLYDLANEAGWPLERDLGGGHDRIPLFGRALDALSGHPTLVVIEDVHWADDATLDFIRFFGRRIANRYVLLLLTARTDGSEVQRRARRAVSDIPSDRLTRIDVPMLSEAAVIDLAKTSGQDGRALFSATAGNAFYVTECLRADGGLPPSSIRDAVLARAERLPDAARAVLDAASVFPRAAEADLLEALCPDAAAGLTDCLAAGLLEARDRGYAFRHEIARRSVELDVPEPRRRALNARLLSALRGRSEMPFARLVHHAREAGDDAAVRDLAPDAARQASRLGAHRQALGYYQVLLEQADAFAVEYRADLFERFAFESHVTGGMSQAIAAQAEARRLRASLHDAIGEGACLRWLSRLSYLAGDREAADRYGQAAVAVLEPAGPSATLAMAWSNLSQLAMLGGHGADALVSGERAIAMAETFGRADIVCHALNNIGVGLEWRNPDAGRAYLDRALTVARDGGFDEEVARIYTNRGCLELENHALDDAARFLRDGIDYCTERDLDTWRFYMLGCLAQARLFQGRWDEAGMTAFTVVANAQATPLMRFPAVVALARLRLRRGDPDAVSLIDELYLFLDKGREFPRLAACATVVAEQAWLEGRDPAPALRLIDEAMEVAPEGYGLGELVMWRLLLVPDDVLPPLPIVTPYDRILAGDWTGAAKASRDLGMPYETALALTVCGRVEALAIFDGLGARVASRRACQGLRAAGVVVPVAPHRNEQLTAREHEVLSLIARGESNKTIARSLNISPKTVDHHVSAVLRKLDAASRSQAAARARDAGWL